jgi:hypothetical protein
MARLIMTGARLPAFVRQNLFARIFLPAFVCQHLFAIASS